jgi:hypothetical protein
MRQILQHDSDGVLLLQNGSTDLKLCSHVAIEILYVYPKIYLNYIIISFSFILIRGRLSPYEFFRISPSLSPGYSLCISM